MSLVSDRLSRWFLPLLGVLSIATTIVFIFREPNDPLHLAVVEGGFALLLGVGLVAISLRDYTWTDLPENHATTVALGATGGFGLLLVMNLWFRLLESTIGLVEVHFVAVTSLTAGTLGGAVVGIAVAQNRRAHAIREAALEDYRVIFDQVEDAIVVHEADTFAIREANSKAEELLGYTAAELKNGDVFDIIGAHPEVDAADAEAKLQAALDSESERFEWPVERNDGTQRWLEVTLTESELRGGACILAVFRDITDQRDRRMELQRYETVIDRMPDSVFMFDSEGHCTYANPAAIEATRSSRSELIGAPMETLLSPDVVDADQKQTLVDRFEEVLEGTRREVRDTMTFETAMGTVHTDASTFRVESESGELLGVVSVARDITQRVETEQAIRRKNERLDEFTSVVSHDLRNPLGVAQGRLELAQTECDSEHLPAVAEAHERMETLIDDLLQLARQGDDLQETHAVELAAVVRKAWETVETKKASLSIDVERTIQADAGRLRQLLENLFRNAVQHGGDDVTVTVGAIDDGFFVEDDGVGIAFSEPEQVFEVGVSMSPDGTGVGLSIVKQIAEAHGWGIRVCDAESGGARFELTSVEAVS